MELTSQFTEPGLDSQSGGVLRLNLELFNNGEAINQNMFQQSGYTLNPKPFDIKISDAQVEYTLVFNESGDLELQVILPDGLSEGSEYGLQIDSIASIVTQEGENGSNGTNFLLDDSAIPEVKFTKAPEVSEDDVAMAENVSKAAGDAASVTAGVSDTLALMGVILSADQSGATLKFSQISKLISRLRMVDLNFGEIFGKFLDSMGKAFDGESSGKSDEENVEIYKTKQQLFNLLGKDQLRKFNLYAIKPYMFGTMRNNWEKRLIQNRLNNNAITPSERLLATETTETFDESITFSGIMAEVKYWVYIVSWMIKLWSFQMLAKFKRQHFINLKMFKFINIHRKIHFLLFNLCVIDIAFTGTRTFVHMRVVREVAYHFFLTFVIAMLALFDVIEIAWVSANVMYYGKPKEAKKADSEAKVDQSSSKKLKGGKLKGGKKPKQDLDETVTKNLLIEDVQVKDKDFDVKQLAGLDLKESYREEFMISNVMSTQTAEKIGYVREVDYKKTERLMLSNRVIEEHATAELKKDNPDLYSKKSILLANFSFVLRIVGYHLALVTLASNALICCIVLLLLEVAYLSLIVRNFLKLRYLISIHLFISKATQSFFLIVFHLISLSILANSGVKLSPGVGI
jgi:hypothetical protein